MYRKQKRMWAGLKEVGNCSTFDLTWSCTGMAVLGTPELVTRGSEGIIFLTHNGTTWNTDTEHGSISTSHDCRAYCFSPEGSQLAWCDGKSVPVLDLHSHTLRYNIPRPKTRLLRFSPKGTYLTLWEPYTVTKDQPVGSPNLQIWTAEKVAEFIQKKQQDWCPQWSEDEQLCARNVTNEVHFFDGGLPGPRISRKLQIEGMATFALSPGKSPYKIAVYTPGNKGAPSFVRLYEYPRLEGAGAIVASKSFYRADTVSFLWNKKGSAVLVTTTTDMDKTGASYYGEQGLHYLSARGDGNMVQLGKKGPIYSVEWNPNSEEFCVVYGFMPSKATLFNCKCDPIYDFGTGHRNTVHFNPQGNSSSPAEKEPGIGRMRQMLGRSSGTKLCNDAIGYDTGSPSPRHTVLCLAGFGNLRGVMELWDRKALKLLSKPQASDSTQFEWCPDGIHIVTATTAPRLREGNGFKVWHFKGSLIHQQDTPPKHQLWEVRWHPFPAGTFPVPDIASAPPPSVIEPQPQAKKAAYRPPALRGKPSDFKLHEQEPPQGASTEKEQLSKSAMKNKRKRESKQRSRQQGVEGGHSGEQQDAISVASHLMGGRSGGGGKGGAGSVSIQRSEGDVEREKKLKNLKKKLRQIEQLKQQQEEGKELQANQLEKIQTQQSLLEEIAKLEL